ncbi:hypothetical protein ACSQ6I_07245 [Anabaena sp. WFMT]|uniref:hypothetical protein n=1 Tax=Anabaena sp. WFMT TaxID=3449730 RepID=UPI003F26FA04
MRSSIGKIINFKGAVKLLVLSSFLTLGIANKSYATNNCGLGRCQGLPSEVGSASFQETISDWINIVPPKPVIPGSFNANKEDPSNEDDSFLYYLNIDRYRSYNLFERITQTRNNSCTSCASSVKQTWTYQKSHTSILTESFTTQLQTLFNSSLGTIGQQVNTSLTFTDQWNNQITQGTEITEENINCCSVVAWFRQYKITEIQLDIGYQKDYFGGWENHFLPDKTLKSIEFIGLDRRTAQGVCTTPEPSLIASLFLTVGFAFTSVKKTRKRVGKLLEHDTALS